MVLTKEQAIHQILEHLNSDNRLFASDIYVDIKDCRVILSGVVPTMLAKKVAEENAYMVPQVMFVENYLKVREFEDHQPGEDNHLRNQVKTAIQLNRDFEHYPVNVIALKGKVTLEGSVDIYWKKILAGKIASSIKDVKEVINNLTINPGKRVLDDIIARRIMIQVSRKKIDGIKYFSLAVNNGMVTANGKVKDVNTVLLIKKIILTTIGVIGFQDEITIERHLEQ